jgi:hypothetical protein
MSTDSWDAAMFEMSYSHRRRRSTTGHAAESAMMSTYRLSSVSPTLAERFRGAPTGIRRQAALVACEIAVSSVGLRDKEILLALEALRSGTPLDSALRGQVERLAASFDDEYLRLEEEEDEGKKAEVLSFFSRARAASAIMFALSDDAGQLHETIYEAITSLENPAELVQSVETVLR